MDYVKFIYQPLVARAARKVLVDRNRARQSPDRGRFTRANVDDLLKTAWVYYAQRAGNLPPEPTVGSRMNVRLACFTMSFFDALLAIDTEREYAIELVADAAWKVYRLWSIIALGLARLTPGRTTALAFAVSKHGDCQGDVSLRFPFNAPGYLIEPVPTDSGTAFDVVRCPIADYFRGQGAIDLCTASWCDLDYALAELTDEKLVRTKTLVRGNDRCDFRLDYKRPTSNPRADKPAPEMASPGQDGPRLSAPDSRVWVWVIPTNEELMIAHRPRRDYRAALRGVALSASRSIAPHLLDVVAPCTPS